ncbi:MAG TPA: alpha/beta hydrolase [Chloroflexota bacterium]|nr:alpha/beta hydrolase [Chloroflexota bacterium]
MNWFSGDVETNGIRMHYFRTGGDGPPLVLSHGATDSGLCWTRVTQALEADYDVIMPDARGHGRSDAPETGYTAADHAADLAGLIRALGLDRPAVGGHSMGAGSTLRLVADYPDLAGCAILEDPPIWVGERPAPPPGREHPREAMRRIVVDAQTNDLQTTIARARAASPLWAEEEFGPWADAKQHVSRQFLDAPFAPAQDWRELLPRISCPVLLVTSDPERGGIVTPDAALEASRILPGLQVVRLSGAGHNIRRERFDAYVDAIRTFLATAYPRMQARVGARP